MRGKCKVEIMFRNCWWKCIEKLNNWLGRNYWDDDFCVKIKRKFALKGIFKLDEFVFCSRYFNRVDWKKICGREIYSLIVSGKMKRRIKREISSRIREILN